MHYVFRLIVAGSMLGCASCASVDTYTDATLKRDSRTGILYYPPKPYLLVSRTGAKDKPTDVQVVYMPDLSQPRYAVMQSGFGSSKLGLTFSNGVLVSANQESDPKIVEAITALAGIPSALATAAKTNAEADQIREEAADLPKAAGFAQDAAGAIEAILADTAAPTTLTSNQIESLRRLPALLRNAATALNAPGASAADSAAALATLEGVKRTITEIKPATTPGEPALTFWNKIREAERLIDQAVAALKPAVPEAPTVTLYEVLTTRTGTTLREVPVSTLSSGAAIR